MAWSDYYDREMQEIAELMRLAEPPTRVETIKEGWAALRPLWPTHEINGKCVLVHDLGIVADILYEQVKYGDIWVIEAEGVIVERLPSR